MVPTIMLVNGNLDTTFLLTAFALIFPTTFLMIQVFLAKFFILYDSIAATRDKIAGLIQAVGHDADDVETRPPGSSIELQEMADLTAPLPDVSGRNILVSNDKSPIHSIRTPDLPTVSEKEENNEFPSRWAQKVKTELNGQDGDDESSQSQLDVTGSEIDSASISQHVTGLKSSIERQASNNNVTPSDPNEAEQWGVV